MTLILTEEGHLINFHDRMVTVMSPCPEIWKKFGMFYFRPSNFGYQTVLHDSYLESHNPQPGQNLCYFLNSHGAIVNTHQTILRVYSEPLKVAPKQIKSVWHMLDYAQIPSNLLVNLKENDRTNGFLSLILVQALQTDNTPWTFDKIGSDFIRRMSELQDFADVNLWAIFDCGLLTDKDGLITISDGLKILLMESIHRARPASTVFNSQGILEYLRP